MNIDIKSAKKKKTAIFAGFNRLKSYCFFHAANTEDINKFIIMSEFS